MNREMDRAVFLKASAAIASGLTIGNTLFKAIPASAKEHQPIKIEAAYVPTWEEYDSIDKEILSKLNRLFISFAIPDKTGEVVLGDGINHSLAKMLGNLSTGTEVMLAIGGASAPVEGWQAALEKPEKFSRSTAELLSKIHRQTDTQIQGVDIDFEYPAAGQKSDLIELIKNLRHVLPDKEITMAIPATSYGREGFDFKKLAHLIDRFNVMSYDKTGSWSPEADDMAPGLWVIDCIKQAVKLIGDEKQVVAGFPAYANVFTGAHKKGDYFKKDKFSQPGYSTIPKDAIKDDMRDLTSEAMIDGNWVSCVSPRIINKEMSILYKEFPHLAGRFYWDISGLTPAHLEAVRVK